MGPAAPGRRRLLFGIAQRWASGRQMRMLLVQMQRCLGRR